MMLAAETLHVKLASLDARRRTKGTNVLFISASVALLMRLMMDLTARSLTTVSSCPDKFYR
jgi:hypothetical protein